MSTFFPRSLSLGPICSLVVVLGGGLVACTVDRSDDALATSAALADCSAGAADAIPEELRCTGLYSDWTARTIDPKIEAFSPGFELWSDGAEKTRFISLPPGSKIDARDMNAWVFPVGTKLWKEFRLHTSNSGDANALSLVETRMSHKTGPNQWVFATYVWSPAQDEARRVTTGLMPLPGTENYEVPSERTCRRCHDGRSDKVLGFEAVLLAAPEAKGLTYERLVARGLLETGEPKPPASSDLQIPGNPVERAAIGRLHANCGLSCHHPDGPAPFSMRIDAALGKTPASVDETSVFREAIGQESFFTPMNGAGTYYRIRPTDEDGSTIFYRMGRRDAPGGHEQMPPVATHRPDPAFLDAVGSWIRSMTAAPYPTPGPR